MKMSAVDIRTGMVLEHEGRLWRVSRTMHTQPGKGGAYMQVEMKDIVSGTKTNNRFRSSEAVERAVLEQRPMQFLYASDDMLYMMDAQTYEQTPVPAEILGEQLDWLLENMDVTVETHEGRPLGITLPNTVELEVVEADPALRGQTASSSFKNAKLSNGVSVLVPTFIEAGERIIVSTADGSYVERA